MTALLRVAKAEAISRSSVATPGLLPNVLLSEEAWGELSN